MARYPRQTLQKIQVRLFTEDEVTTVKLLAAKMFDGNESAAVRFLIREAGKAFGVIPKDGEETEIVSEKA